MSKYELPYPYAKHLKYLPYAQCCYLNYSDRILLISYKTEVIRYYKETRVFNCTGLYSRSTIGHISEFMKQFFPSYTYFDVKFCVNYQGGEMLIKKGGFIDNK